MRADVDERRKRLIAFIVITLVFVISIAALLYWAINVAAARINSRITAYLQAPNPPATVERAETILLGEALIKPSNCVMAWLVF